MQVAVMPNTLAFNHALAALETAASQPSVPPLCTRLAEHSVRLFHGMQHRAGSPPDCRTYDLLMGILTKVGAESQALQVYDMKLQKVGMHTHVTVAATSCDAPHTNSRSATC